MRPYTPITDIHAYVLKQGDAGCPHNAVTVRFIARYDAATRNAALSQLIREGKIHSEKRKPPKGPVKFHYYATGHRTPPVYETYIASRRAKPPTT